MIEYLHSMDLDCTAIRSFLKAYKGHSTRVDRITLKNALGQQDMECLRSEPDLHRNTQDLAGETEHLLFEGSWSAQLSS